MQPVNLTDTAAAAKILGFKHHKLLKALRDNCIFHREGNLKNTPFAKYIERGYFLTSIGTFSKHGIDTFYSKAMITPLGLSFLRELINGLEEGPGLDNRTRKQMVHGQRQRPQNQQAANEQRDAVLSMVATIEERPRVAGRL